MHLMAYSCLQNSWVLALIVGRNSTLSAALSVYLSLSLSFAHSLTHLVPGRGAGECSRRGCGQSDRARQRPASHSQLERSLQDSGRRLHGPLHHPH